VVAVAAVLVIALHWGGEDGVVALVRPPEEGEWPAHPENSKKPGQFAVIDLIR